jgi:hypothetical protein
MALVIGGGTAGALDELKRQMESGMHDTGTHDTGTHDTGPHDTGTAITHTGGGH